ncbi:hypothetical protein AB0P21_13700 [Kribbella sp. NPDC056861]|uniref:hypothetical protein n=1 Tax=Kribbella sp. NPDC056861 TaxID=3154857 RepID=UPI0034411111
MSSPAPRSSRRRTAGAIAAAGLAIAGFTITAGPAEAGTTYTNAYNTMKACQTNQRSLGHSSSIRIVKSCYEYYYACHDIQCSIGYAFSWTYR